MGKSPAERPDILETVHAAGATELAILDPTGMIIAVNDSWHRFCLDNGGDPRQAGIGRSYLEMCDAAADDPAARAVGHAIRIALADDLPAPLVVRINCDSPARERQFDVLIASRRSAGVVVGATVTLSSVPDPEAAAPRLQKQPWHDAGSQVSRRLLLDPDRDSLTVVVEHAQRTARARRAMLVTPVSDTCGRVVAFTGSHVTGDRLMELSNTLAGKVLLSGTPHLLGRPGTPSPTTLADLADGTGSAIGVPLLASDGCVSAALTVERTVDQPRFTTDDQARLVGYAEQTALVLDLARERRERDFADRLADRDRIATQLHEQVIGELFTVGIGLQGLIGAATDPVQQNRIMKYADSLDLAIGRIRAAVFRMQSPEADHDSAELGPRAEDSQRRAYRK